MCSRFLSLALATFVLAAPAAADELRVCADPNNLPFSNQAGEGFENKIVELLAADLGLAVSYTWWAQRRGYVRNTLNAGLCDLMPGAPAGYERVATTKPYYRSTYVFVQRADAKPIRSFDDPALRNLRIGVQLIGDDGVNTPPAHALSRRGILDNVRGYPVYGDYSQPNPPARIITAVAKGEIDVALVWGPLAGYFAPRQSVALEVTPVPPQSAGDYPMAFAIAMGVRKGNEALRASLQAALMRHRPEIDAILDAYGVPRAPGLSAEAAR